MSTESNTLASANGCEMEDIIKALYPGAKFEFKGVIDFLIDGVRVEVKSCQEYVIDNSAAHSVRSGRFCFTDLQHQTLLENSGEYIFLVHRSGVPIFYTRVQAARLKLGKFHGVKSVCWKTAIRGVI